MADHPGDESGGLINVGDIAVWNGGSADSVVAAQCRLGVNEPVAQQEDVCVYRCDQCACRRRDARAPRISAASVPWQVDQLNVRIGCCPLPDNVRCAITRAVVHNDYLIPAETRKRGNRIERPADVLDLVICDYDETKKLFQGRSSLDQNQARATSTFSPRHASTLKSSTAEKNALLQPALNQSCSSMQMASTWSSQGAGAPNNSFSLPSISTLSRSILSSW